jgi:methyl-accepting chemotaxis protein
MFRQKKTEKITEEALELVNITNQFINGDLELSIDTGNYTFLGDLAEDINQISMTFNTYINEIAHILSHLSAGNMAVSFTKEIDYQGDFLPIRNALHKIRHSLNSSFEEINLLAGEVDTLCTRVESGASQIAKNATEEAELINDLTSTMYQITEQTANNAVHAKSVSDSVLTIQSEAETGSNYMDQMLASIGEVKTSSDAISNVITIISEIAGRTKLLALNASIEAARAGDAGRGFDIVAKEVGLLAEKSTDAVKKTTQLINDSIDTVEASVSIAYKTSDSFRKIQNSIDHVARLCTDIAEVSKVQAENLRNTSAIITDISGSVQSNAACAQENCAGASDLAGLSARLKTVMTKFRLKKDRVTAANSYSVSSIGPDLEKELFDRLQSAYRTEEIDRILEDIIVRQNDFECLYVIDGQGHQLSHTVMKPEIIVEQDDNFKPAMPGDFYGTKKYFRQALKNPEGWYVSVEYISTATGGLCKTLSHSYSGQDNKTYVICIDLICRF